MNKILFFIFFALISQIGNTYEVPCDKRLQSCLNKILKLPSARQLIAEVQQQGSIRIEVANHLLSQQFGAFWDRQNRVIGIYLSSRVSEGDIMGSIIFELHNALTNQKIDQIDCLANSRQIGRDKYIEAM